MARGGLTPARLRAILGGVAGIGTARDGTPRVAPRNTDECAFVLGRAAADGWRVRVEGAGGWIPPDAPADVALTTEALGDIHDVSAADLVATTGAGVPCTEFRHRLADHGAWMALEPLGTDRTLGGLAATGGGGPLQAGFGTLRDQVLGLTLVTGDGRILKVGGRVMKNVAGYDLAKLAIGSYGAFGVVTSLHLRLRAVPRADVTMQASGSRDTLLDAARAILDTGITPAAVELFGPHAAGGTAWTLTVRLVGTEEDVASCREAALAAVHGLVLAPVEPSRSAAVWAERLAAVTEAPVTVRLAALQDGLQDALDLVAHHLDETIEDWISVTVPAGIVRWSGAPSPDRVALLRRTAAEREMPLTVERAPWSVRAQLGHFGAYREGVSRLVARLRRTFDPAGVLVVPLDNEA